MNKTERKKLTEIRDTLARITMWPVVQEQVKKLDKILASKENKPIMEDKPLV